MSEKNINQQELFDLARKKEPATAGTATSSQKTINNTYDNTIISDCQAKLEEEFNAAKLSQKGNAVGQAVVDALNDFASQNSEFAQAVLQSDKPVADCIEYTVKGCGNSISDLDVYKRAVEFYFTGATVHMTLAVDVGDEGFSNNNSAINLNLDSLLDF